MRAFRQIGIGLTIVFCGFVPRAAADALMVTKAMTASTIAEVFVEPDVVRVELEIGLRDIEAFRNLLPDELYERLGHDPLPLAERWGRFVTEDWVMRADGGAPLLGRIERMEPRPLLGPWAQTEAS